MATIQRSTIDIKRRTIVKLAGSKWGDLGSRPVMPMSLNLRETFCWGWLLPGPKGMQLAVEQAIETLSQIRSADLLAHWVDVLRRNEVLGLPIRGTGA